MCSWLAARKSKKRQETPSLVVPQNANAVTIRFVITLLYLTYLIVMTLCPVGSNTNILIPD